MDPAADPSTVRRQLDLVRIVAIADALLLVPLVIAAVQDSDLTRILGPIHGVGFLLLVFLTVRGVGERLWGWWFPALVVVTVGPPGSLIGDVRIRRHLPAR